MAKQRGRTGGNPPVRPDKEIGQDEPGEPHEAAIGQDPTSDLLSPAGLPMPGELQTPEEETTVRENIQGMSPSGWRANTPDGVSVTGEAVRRVAPESAEFLIEIVTSAPAAAQALRDNQAKTAQLLQALTPLGIQQQDLQTISMNVFNIYSPMPRALPGFSAGAYGAIPAQIGGMGFAAPAMGTAASAQPEAQYNPYDVQFGAYHARNTMRVNVREAARLGEVADAAARSGANVLGGFTVRVSDETAARRGALEAAGRDARSKAEALATAAGKKVGDPVAIAEEIVASNGAYMALRTAMPFAFGAGAPQATGELEYYARVSARFNFQ